MFICRIKKLRKKKVRKMKEEEMIDAGGPHEGNSVVNKSRERKCSVFHMGTWPNNSSVIFMAVSSLRNFPCFGLTCPNLGLCAHMKIQGKFSHARVRPIKRTNELSFFLFVFFSPLPLSIVNTKRIEF